MTLDGFRDVTETPISLDFSNSWIADIRLNAGDKDGRTITVAITDNGQPITSTTGIKSVALAYNTAPGVEVGDRVPMSPVSGEATATYRATLPRRAIAKPGVIALGVEVTTADGVKVCSRNFKGVVERAVWDAESTQGQDSLTRLEQLIADGDAAIIRVNNAITDANNAVAAANQVIADARITGGNTTTLDPNQPATSSLRGSGLQRILDALDILHSAVVEGGAEGDHQQLILADVVLIAAVVLGSIAGVAAKVVRVSLFALDQLLLGIGQGIPCGLGGLTLGIGVIGALLHIDGIDQVCNVLCGQFVSLLAGNLAAGSRSCRAGSSGAACGTAAAGQYTGAQSQSGQSGRCFVDGAFSHFCSFLSCF